jgi:hypothetical protein
MKRSDTLCVFALWLLTRAFYLLLPTSYFGLTDLSWGSTCLGTLLHQCFDKPRIPFIHVSLLV